MNLFYPFFIILIQMTLHAEDIKTINNIYFDEQQLKQLEQYLFEPPKEFDHIKTHSLLIMKNNEIIYERYKSPFNKQTKYLSWSIAKTIAGLLIGIAEKEGILNRQTTIGQLIPWLQHLKKQISIDHLLRMSSGINFSEIYDGAIWQHDIHSMLFKQGAKDMGRYVLQLPMAYLPGERFYYSSGDTNLLMYLLKLSMQKEQYDQFPFEKFFRPLGIENATFEQDASGTFIGSTYLYLRLEDFAKIGQLFINKGMVNQQQIVTSKWIDYMSTLTPSFHHVDNIDNIHGYGAQLWLNYTLSEEGNKVPVYPSLPIDTLFLQGFKGQLITIIPSENLIFVRAALDDNYGPNKDYYFSLLLKSLKGIKHKPVQYSTVLKTNAYEKKVVLTRTLEEGVLFPGVGINRRFFSIFNQINNLTAHFICSCHFVQKNDLNYCQKTYGKYTVIFKTTFEPPKAENNLTVSVYNLFGVGKAFFKNTKLGCTIRE